MIVYLVTHDVDCGYSSYSVTKGVFSTREGAMHYKQKNGGDYEIEEVVVDEALDGLTPLDPTHKIGSVYSVTIRVEDGKDSSLWGAGREDLLRHPSNHEVRYSPGDEFITAKSPISESHARQVATETRSKLINTMLATLDDLCQGIAAHLGHKEAIAAHTEVSFRKGWRMTIKLDKPNDLVVAWDYKQGFNITLGSMKSHSRDPKEVLSIIKTIV